MVLIVNIYNIIVMNELLAFVLNFIATGNVIT